MAQEGLCVSGAEAAEAAAEAGEASAEAGAAAAEHQGDGKFEARVALAAAGKRGSGTGGGAFFAAGAW